MIGIVAKERQRPAVEEFFELFKTPWEFYTSGRTYDVVVVTADEIPEVDAKLLLVYGATARAIDERFGNVTAHRQRNGVVEYDGKAVPIYGELRTFHGGDRTYGQINTAAAGIRLVDAQQVIIRVGYDLFDEVQFVLMHGQPVAHAQIPTLDIQIQMLRECILKEGIPVLEIPPKPAGHSFAVCLTHDIDFLGIRRHRFDHTMWGFVYRATLGALWNLARGRLSFTKLIKSWWAVASLPLVYAGWAADFWEPFEWFLRIEKDLPATYFLIPFKRRPGQKVIGRHASRRAAAYDVSDISKATIAALSKSCELGVHGIDAWHDSINGREELGALQHVTQRSEMGVRMHWLLSDEATPSRLEDAGYAYDSTSGYNDAIGYRSGTGQVFRPLGARALLELPLHIQDGALFYPRKLDLSQAQAEKSCQALIDNARAFGGVLTLLWHDRSHAPERFWGDFYLKLVQKIKSMNAWFGTAAQLTGWFRKRREVRFDSVETPTGRRVRLYRTGNQIHPPLCVRLYEPTDAAARGRAAEAKLKFSDVPWNGWPDEQLEFQLGTAFSTVTS